MLKLSVGGSHGPDPSCHNDLMRKFASVLLLAAMATTAAGVASAAGDPQRGAKLFGACAACHSVEPNRHMTGPSLFRIWGRKAGSVRDYHRYSDQIKRSGLVWNEQTLDAWLRDPQKLVPGNAMAFAGIPDDAARADIIAVLKAVSEGKAERVPQMPPLPNLKQAPADVIIASIRHCGDSYFVTNAKGEEQAYWEFNLRFKTDTSSNGPSPGKPVMVGQGMQGDRAQVVFASPREFSNFIREQCK
jgi:cytochrome c